MTKTCVDGKISREGALVLKGACTPAVDDTTSEPQGRNALPGAPVKASMSDGQGRNQGGTVEYFCIPPLIFQGVGIFYTFPTSKGGKIYVRRKSVHL